MPKPFDTPSMPEEIREAKITEMKTVLPWLENVLQMSDFTKSLIGDEMVYYFHSRRSPVPIPITFDVLIGMTDGRSKLKWWKWCSNNIGGRIPSVSIGSAEFAVLLSIANITEVVEEPDTSFQDALLEFAAGFELWDTEPEALAHLKGSGDIVRPGESETTCTASMGTECTYLKLTSLRAWLRQNRQETTGLAKFLKESGWSPDRLNDVRYWRSPKGWGPAARECQKRRESAKSVTATDSE